MLMHVSTDLSMWLLLKPRPFSVPCAHVVVTTGYVCIALSIEPAAATASITSTPTSSLQMSRPTGRIPQHHISLMFQIVAQMQCLGFQN